MENHNFFSLQKDNPLNFWNVVNHASKIWYSSRGKIAGFREARTFYILSIYLEERFVFLGVLRGQNIIDISLYISIYLCIHRISCVCWRIQGKPKSSRYIYNLYIYIYISICLEERLRVLEDSGRPEPSRCKHAAKLFLRSFN